MVGYGLSVDANGGILGQDHFMGNNYEYSDYSTFIYYLSLCVMMAAIATGSIAERTHTDTYIFFSFVTSGFIFPIGLAWCWNDGWLTNLGFLDYGGASIVHLMGGMAGFIGTYLVGPRIGNYKADTRMAYVLDDEVLGDDAACAAMEQYINKKNIQGKLNQELNHIFSSFELKDPFLNVQKGESDRRLSSLKGETSSSRIRV